MNIYIDDLLTQLHQAKVKALAFAFADDLVLVVKGELALNLAIRRVKAGCSANEVEINAEKSAVMSIRVDKRTPKPKFSKVLGLPLKETYSYLGIVLTIAATAAH